MLAAPVALLLHKRPHAARAQELSVIPESSVLGTLPKQQREGRRLPLASKPQQNLWDLFLKAGDASDYCDEYRDLDGAEFNRYKERWQASVDALAHRDAGPGLSVLYKLEAWLCQNCGAPFSPRPHHLAACLDIQSRRRPLVAPGMVKMFAW